MMFLGDDTPPSPDGDAFDNILNFRDVGKTVNQYLGQRVVREGVLFRSARPDDASLGDRRLLKVIFGIKTVVDLRTKTELMNAAMKRQAGLITSRHTNPALAEPIHIPGLRYLEIKLTSRRFEIFLVRQLSWLGFIKVIFLFLFGFRMRAYSIIGREVMLPRGLVGLGLDTLDKAGPEITETLDSFLQTGGVPSLIHCTQGKDRTGLVVILVLLILGIQVDAIDYDYRLSDEALLVEKGPRLAEIREIGLTDEWGMTSKVLVGRAVEHLDTRYGGVEQYLDGIGFDDLRRGKLRELMLY